MEGLNDSTPCSTTTNIKTVMTTYDNLPPRGKSQRIAEKANREKTKNLKLQQLKQHRPILKPTVTDLYPGLNEISDAFEAFPNDLIRYFTLLKEIDAKCVYTVPYLKAYVQRFLQMKKTHPKRELLLSKIRNLIKELMPCLEEKMHVATIASDSVNKHLKRINQAYDIIEEHEIPEIVRIGPLVVPCMKLTEPKSAQTQRSETRREALAARRKKHSGEDTDDVDDTHSNRSTPVPSHTTTTKRRGAHKRTETTNSTTTQGPKKRKTNNSTNAVPEIHVEADKIVPSVKKPKANKPKKERKDIAVPVTVSTPVVTASTNLKSTVVTTTSKKTSSAPATKTAKKEPIVHEEYIPIAGANFETEPVYCYCQQVSYGEMVGCDGEHCEREWFHLPCTDLKELPKGEWYCDDCKAKMKKTGRA